MGKKNWAQMTSTEVMAAKIDKIYDRLSLIENLLVDLSPGFGKISKEIGPTIKDLREVYERDETLILVKKAGENIPTFLELLNLMEAMKGLMEDLMPAIGKISKEVMPSINMLRESIEKDEVLGLLQKTGENINVFNKLLDFLNKFDKSGTLDYTLENIAGREMDVMLKGIQTTASKTMQQFMEKPPEPGLGNLIKAMRDPEVQKGLLFLTAFAKNLSRCMTEACMFESPK